MLTLGLAIVAVIVINAVFTFIQEYRAKKALEAFKKLFPFNVKAIRIVAFIAAVVGETTRLLLTTAALCNNARFADNQYRGDPVE